MPTTPATFNGYKPRLEMPVVAPPPASFTGAPLDYYQGLQIDVGVVISGPNNEYVDITLARAANSSLTTPVDATLYAMTGGFVTFYPEGMQVPAPDSFEAPVNGVVVLTTWIDDVTTQQRVFPPDMPAIGRVYYVGVDLAQTALILKNETLKMSDAALRVSWKNQNGTAAPSGTTHDDLAEQHKTLVMTGLGSVFVDGGTAIGRAAQDTAAGTETYTFSLRMADSGPPMSYVSPIPVFRGVPYYEL